MREERGHIRGNVMVREPYTLWGSIAGNVRVMHGSKFYMRGAVYGNLDAEPGGRVHILGTVSGSVIVGPKSKVIISGTIGGDVTNIGGRLYIDATGGVLGKVNSQAGETTIEPNARVNNQG